MELILLINAHEESMRVFCCSQQQCKMREFSFDDVLTYNWQHSYRFTGKHLQGISFTAVFVYV